MCRQRTGPSSSSRCVSHASFVPPGLDRYRGAAVMGGLCEDRAHVRRCTRSTSSCATRRRATATFRWRAIRSVRRPTSCPLGGPCRVAGSAWTNGSLAAPPSSPRRATPRGRGSSRVARVRQGSRGALSTRCARLPSPAEPCSCAACAPCSTATRAPLALSRLQHACPAGRGSLRTFALTAQLD